MIRCVVSEGNARTSNARAYAWNSDTTMKCHHASRQHSRTVSVWGSTEMEGGEMMLCGQRSVALCPSNMDVGMVLRNCLSIPTIHITPHPKEVKA